MTNSRLLKPIFQRETHRSQTDYPSVFRRYIAALIDASVIWGTIVFGFQLMTRFGVESTTPRISLFLLMLLCYEPILTSRLCTLGQCAMLFRVRTFDDHERIGLARAYGRFLVKATLGIISLFTIPASRERRAIHDMTAGTIVINSPSERSTSPD